MRAIRVIRFLLEGLVALFWTALAASFWIIYGIIGLIPYLLAQGSGYMMARHLQSLSKQLEAAEKRAEKKG